jgi:hypothetical protein
MNSSDQPTRPRSEGIAESPGLPFRRHVKTGADRTCLTIRRPIASMHSGLPSAGLANRANESKKNATYYTIAMLGTQDIG